MNRIKLKNVGISQRPKAFLGSLIGLAGNIAGSIINANAQKKAAREQAKMIEHQNAVNAANNLTQFLGNNAALQEDYENRFRTTYGCGGRRKLKFGGYITDGGYAIPISNNTSLLQGRLHSQVNESGNTGIGINVAGREIEAEGGEVVNVKRDKLRIFSNRLKLPRRGNVTPAYAVLRGDDVDDVFDEQESMKVGSRRSKRFGNGGGVSVIESIAPTTIRYREPKTLEELRKDYHTYYNPNYHTPLGMSITGGDILNIGLGVAGSLISNAIAQGAYNDIYKNYAPKRPILAVPAKLKTNYNELPQLEAIRRARLNTERAINENSYNSSSVLDKMNINNVNAAESENKIYGEKENIETGLVNQDALHREQVNRENIAALNDYYENLNQFNRDITLSKAQSNIGAVQGAGTSISGGIQSAMDRYNDENALLAYVLGAEPGNANLFLSMFKDTLGRRNIRKLRNAGYKV